MLPKTAKQPPRYHNDSSRYRNALDNPQRANNVINYIT